MTNIDTLNETRSHAGLPVQDLARMLGIKRRQFYALISGEDAPDEAQQKRIFRVCTAIGQISALVNGNSRKVRNALLVRLDGASLYNAAVSGDEISLEAALKRALAAIRDGVKIRKQPFPSNRADLSAAGLRDLRIFLAATRDETWPDFDE